MSGDRPLALCLRVGSPESTHCEGASRTTASGDDCEHWHQGFYGFGARGSVGVCGGAGGGTKAALPLIRFEPFRYFLRSLGTPGCLLRSLNHTREISSQCSPALATNSRKMRSGSASGFSKIMRLRSSVAFLSLIACPRFPHGFDYGIEGHRRDSTHKWGMCFGYINGVAERWSRPELSVCRRGRVRGRCSTLPNSTSKSTQTCDICLRLS